MAFFVKYDSSSTANSKQKRKKTLLKSTRYTSPNSYQSSEIVSKKQSREKNNPFKRNKDPTQIKKKKKIKDSALKLKENEKENCYHSLESIISEQFKITKWKNKILK